MEIEVTTDIKEYSNFLTFWSLFISFTILLITLLTKVPVYIFLTACCMLTCTSLIGTFYNTVPILFDVRTKDADAESMKKYIFLDIIAHILPFMILIYSYNVFLKNVYDVKYNFIYSVLIVGIILLIYNGVIDADKVYNKDVFSVFVIMLLLYVASYTIYYKYFLLNKSNIKWP